MKLKIGVLTDGDSIPAWAWEMFSAIYIDGFAEITLVIQNTRPRPSGKSSSILYRCYRWLDRKVFKVKTDAFERRLINTVPGFKADIIKVEPIQKKFSDWLKAEDCDAIRKSELDVLIRLGFRILKGDILNISRFGIWSFHHGDNQVNRGGPPCFWEVMLGWWCTGSVLQVLNDRLDGGTVLYRSWSRTDPLSVNRNANRVYWKSLYFIPRQLKELARLGEIEWRNRVSQRQVENDQYTNAMFSPPKNGQMILLLLTFMWRNIKRKFRELIKREYWQIYVGEWSGQWPAPINKSVAIMAPSGHYFADPVICKHNEMEVLFFEDFEYTKNSAVIRAGIWSNKKLINTQCVIQEPHHLSYPFLLEVEDRYFMIAEMAEARQLILYECVQWPFEWKRNQVLMDNVQGYDPTLVLKDGKYWLFMNQKVHSQASAFDELYLYWTEDILNANWTAHPQNPIVSDVRSARPAGRVYFKDGKWFRPAQDCGKIYGHRIKIQEILKWSELEYEERTHYIIEPDWNSKISGTHTFNFHGTTFVMDSFSR